MAEIILLANILLSLRYFFRNAAFEIIQGVFLTGPPPLSLLSVGRKVTDFKKTLESQTGPPSDRKTPKCLAKLM